MYRTSIVREGASKLFPEGLLTLQNNTSNMVERFVRVKTNDNKIHYGLLQINRSVTVLERSPWSGGKPTDLVLEPESYQLLAPCQPSKIIGVGRNYAAHAAEMDATVPSEPLIFLKPSTAILGHEQNIDYPLQSQQVEYEGELALVIGQTCRQCTLEQAQEFLWGYTIANDITARDLQRSDPQWTRAKGFDGFCPLGPWIVRELNSSAVLQTFVNDETVPRQQTNIDSMIFKPEQLVSYISQVMTLMPGDVILTGTPAGVGPLQVGDRISIKIEGIGTLSNGIALVQNT
jgi:2-keto-4-pentenoate hydratase/2-oxohepta-3-ene-1,7-dioic acid hydratase in catechol pathway